jgi:hypothetical protein
MVKLSAAGWGKVLVMAALFLEYSTAMADSFPGKETLGAGKMLEIGRQIYLTGKLPSGEAVQALAGGDTPISGDQFTCVSCHRRSRLGTSEGGKQVPPVTATALFHPDQVSVTRGVLPMTFKYSGSSRIPYTDETLAQAIREGTDSSGRQLDPLMPRYALNDQTVAALISYLKSEPALKSPGVDDSILHFATVVTEGIDPAKRKTMLDILQGYFQDKNADTRHNTKRAQFSAYKMYQVYRKWQLHVWELKGKESDWAAQLEKYYRAQPVLAMVSGLSAGGWQPMHQFCERFEVACLFPNTEVPVISESDFYTIYFNKGLTLEAETLANHLQNAKDTVRGRPVIQLFRENGEGSVAAKAFRESIQKNDDVRLQDIALTGSQALTPDFWCELFKKTQTGILVLWLDKKDFGSLSNYQGIPSGITAFYGSSGLLDEELPKFSGDAREKLFLIYSAELPAMREPRLMRVKTWLKSKHLPFENERLQANTFLSIQILGEIIAHLLDNFSSAYIIERTEGMLSGFSPGSIYPRLGLGNGQRFASKGGYIVQVSPEGRLSPASGWIVP